MTVDSLELRNFRSFTKAEFNFSPTITIITGPNGSGKSNLLEALEYLSTTHSFRARSDAEAIRFGELVADILGKTNEFTLSLIINQKNPPTLAAQKLFQINKVPKPASGFAGFLRTVVFRPEDLDLLTDGPSLRRRFLDTILGQVDHHYQEATASYSKVVTRRNRLLNVFWERPANTTEELKYWDQELLRTGQIIQEARDIFIKWLNEHLPIITQDLLGKAAEELQLVYLPNLMTAERLVSHHEAELAAKMTLIGPGRDDFETLWAGRDISAYGSRGQERTVILVLKLAELDYIKEITGEKPVLLLDDIFSELDSAHRQAVFNVVGQQQTILTTTELTDELKRLVETSHATTYQLPASRGNVSAKTVADTIMNSPSV